MKRLLFLMAGLIMVAAINAQTLEEIVKNHVTASKSDKLAGLTTIKITGNMSAMGMQIPLAMYLKNPNKIKVTNSFNGQEMTTVFDGEKGYMVNPMTGSSTPVAMTDDQVTQLQKSNLYKNQVSEFFKAGKLTLEGQENVDDKPAFKLKAAAGTNPVFLYLDKQSYLLVKVSTTVQNNGAEMNVDSYMTDYSEVNGVLLPKKTTMMANGMQAGVITYDKIEVNVPMEDTIFKVK
jgi:outer membrane lipoprotein-sorting protein